jgi:hypothetical protein
MVNDSATFGRYRVPDGGSTVEFRGEGFKVVDVASKVAGVSKNFFGAISEAAEADGETISIKGSTSATSEAS